jgi:hypothetical protein
MVLVVQSRRHIERPLWTSEGRGRAEASCALTHSFRPGVPPLGKMRIVSQAAGLTIGS